MVDTALDTEDANAVVSLLLERPAEVQDENEQMDQNPPAVDDDEQKGGEEEEEEKDENEEESWAMGLANAELQEGALEPILDTSLARPRIGKGVFFMILVDAEWELVKFHKSVNAKYQLYNVITNEWCESVLVSADYGRTGESSSRWIIQLLPAVKFCKTLCTFKFIFFFKTLRNFGPFRKPVESYICSLAVVAS